MVLETAAQKDELYTQMNTDQTLQEPTSEWFAIKSRQAFKAERQLTPLCDAVYFPKEIVKQPGKQNHVRAIIPRVLFIKTTREKALELERTGWDNNQSLAPFWIYRFPTEDKIQPIPPRSIELLRLLTANDATRCEIFNKKEFKENEHVRIIGGIYEGYQGYVQRVKKNKHVIVKIEGICLIMLPFIHPDLLQPID